MQERETVAGDRGPRFSVRFDARGGEIALSRPLQVAPGVVVEVLVAGVGKPRAPVVLAGGATRLRHRRSELRDVRVVVELRAVERLAASRELALRVQRAEGMRFVVRLADAWGPLAVEALVVAHGDDLGLALVDVRAPHTGPAPSWSRALALLASAGMPLDESAGLVRVAAPVVLALRHALAPHGWRVPRTSGARVDVETRGASLVLAAPSRKDLGAVVEGEARVLAPVLRALALHDADRARAELTAATSRSAWALRLSAALAVDASEAGAIGEVAGLPAGSPLAAVLALKLALAAGDASAAAAAARRVDGAEPVDEVAAAALGLAAALAEPGAESAVDLALRAAQRAGADPVVLADAAAAAARAGDATALAALLGKAAAYDRASATLALVAAARAALTREVATVVAHAEALAPDDAHVLAARARIATGAAARDLHERSAAAHEASGDATSAARELVRAAAADDVGAAALLSRAVALAPTPDAILALARAELRRGETSRARDALAPLIGMTPQIGLPEALAEAASMQLARHEAQSARSFVDALARIEPGHALLADLRDRVGAALADALALSPERLARLDAFMLAEVARGSTAPAATADALLAALGVPTPDATSLVAAALLVVARVGDDVAREARLVRLASLASTHSARIGDVESLDALAVHASRPEERARLLERVSELHRVASRGGKAARTLAEAAVVRRDAAGLRTALDLAERAGAIDDALAIVRTALEVVGDGPEREALLLRAAALERAKG